MNKYQKIYPELPTIILFHIENNKLNNKLNNDKSVIEKLPLINQENNKQITKNTNQK